MRMFTLVFLVFCSLLYACDDPGNEAVEDVEQTPAPLTLDVFVMGDSWAALSQGEIGGENIVASQLRALGHEVVNEYPFGIGGTTAHNWARADPCADGICNDNNVVDDLLATLLNTPNRPLVYLSIGGNDLGVRGREFDLGVSQLRDTVFSNLKSDIEVIVETMRDVRGDTIFIIPGYANFHFSGTGAEGVLCDTVLRNFFSPNGDINEQLVNSLFAGGSFEGEEISGLVGLFSSLSGEQEGVFYTNHQQLFAPTQTPSWTPSREGTMADCIHLVADNHIEFVENVVSRWETQRP